MVQLQRILGMRPNEIFKMRVGDINTTRDNGVWYYVPGSYKTAKFVGKIVFPLGKAKFTKRLKELGYDISRENHKTANFFLLLGNSFRK